MTEMYGFAPRDTIRPLRGFHVPVKCLYKTSDSQAKIRRTRIEPYNNRFAHGS
jgi:hypothetical protein